MLREDMQIRAGYGRSLSYPTPVEISDTTYVDPDSNELFLGNPALGPVVIDSYDLRWEWYPSGSEALTVGFFYKDLRDPIERFSINRSGSSEPVVSFSNAQSGKVIGVELNGRVELDRLRALVGGPAFIDDLYLGGNFAYQDSEVTMPAGGIDTNPVRRMTGQPEIAATIEFGYTGVEHVVRMAFGYTGDRLINAGVNGLPDEFVAPRLTLGGKWSYNPEFLDRLTVSLELENALDDAYRRTRGGIVTRDYTSGITLGLSAKWRFD
jgi:outer membrane receptor protein involved in Fe transport